MNALMAALSAQLALYGVAWFVVARAFHLYPKVCNRWALGWLFSAVGTCLVYFKSDLSGLPHGVNVNLAINLAVIGAFTFLHHGVLLFMREPISWVPTALALACLALMEFVRSQGQGNRALLAWIFSLAAAIPLGLLTHALVQRLRIKFAIGAVAVVALALPVVLTLVAFCVRAAAVTYSETTGVIELDTGSRFDKYITLVYLVLLGLFNFSLSNLVLGSLIRRLAGLASTDQLTGLFNRRVAMERLAQEHARFQRSGQHYAVIMLDLDHFKTVNDTYGHAAGDVVLKETAQRLLESVRTTDTLARIGGEEFMLLLPLTDIDGAMVYAKRVCERVAATPFLVNTNELTITVSIGVAQAHPKDLEADVVLSRADTALYRAKAQGRNRVEAAPLWNSSDPSAGVSSPSRLSIVANIGTESFAKRLQIVR